MIVSHSIKDAWPIVIPKIQEIYQKHKAILDWKPDQMYCEIWDRRAALFQSDEDDSFCVVRTKYRGDKKILFVWLGYAPNATRGNYVKWLKEIAKNVNANRIEMCSPRMGFDRCREWERTMTTYSMEA